MTDSTISGIIGTVNPATPTPKRPRPTKMSQVSLGSPIIAEGAIMYRETAQIAHESKSTYLLSHLVHKIPMPREPNEYTRQLVVNPYPDRAGFTPISTKWVDNIGS
jgi:hypothetical protein